jgi:hypothetical protein
MKTRHALPVMVALLFSAAADAADAPPTEPPTAPPTFLRGVVSAIDNDSVTLTLASGESRRLALAPDCRVSVLKPIELAKIQPGSFIGSAEMPQKNGTGRSLEVHVFPPGVKAGEGHYAWDLKPGSMMTNGTVGKVVAKHRGLQLEVAYPNGHRRMIVPRGTPIVEITPGEPAMIKVGIAVFAIVGKAADGSDIVGGLSIGENGATPPM